MGKKLLELLNAINEKKKLVQSLADEDRLEDAAKAKEELKEMQQKFDLLKDLDNEEEQSMKDELSSQNPANIMKPSDDSDKPMDAVKEFANAARAGFKLSNAMESGMSEGSDEDGGYTVPEDIQTKINSFKQSQFSLESLIAVEPVIKTKGRRIYEVKSETTGFAEIEEGEELSEMDTPKLQKAIYAIKDRGGWLPLTNDLLSDSDANITEFITRWIARKSNATSNTKILELMRKKAVEEIETMDALKKAIIVTLGADYRENAKILTNDDGLLFLATLKDTTGRDLLQPNPTEAMRMYLTVGPLRIPVISVPNKIIASNKQTTGKLKIPMICGEFTEAFKKYDRQHTTLLSSTVASAGKLNAFTQNLTLVRAIERNDFQILDNDAFVNLSMAVNDATVAGDDAKYTEEELNAMTVDQIKALAADCGYSITQTTKAEIIAEFMQQQG